MWVEYCERYEWGTMYKYVLKNKVACRIRFVQNRVPTPQKWEQTYRGVIYKEDGIGHSGDVIYNKDLDIIKLICLLRAKELGWTIDKVV